MNGTSRVGQNECYAENTFVMTQFIPNRPNSNDLPSQPQPLVLAFASFLALNLLHIHQLNRFRLLPAPA